MSRKLTEIEKIRLVVESTIMPLTAKKIVELIKQKWGDSNPRTIRAEIQILTVNSNSRIHHAYNWAERRTDQGSQIDFLFKTDNRMLEKYNPLKHGVWEIYKASESKWAIREFERNKRAFLFVWNSQNWPWEKMKSGIETLNAGGQFVNRWMCSSYRAIRPGDRAFLIRLGEEPRGIVASGDVSSEPFIAEHYSVKNKTAHYVNIEFDVILDPKLDQILEISDLSKGQLKKQKWNCQASGISIRSELLEQLENLWFEVTALNDVQHANKALKSEKCNGMFEEGRKYDVVLSRSERNPYARKACIEHWGSVCSVCKFDFVKAYGSLGEGYIHVHHLIPISKVNGKSKVDPKEHLRPVCPNCHAMIHRIKTPKSIEEMMKLILENKHS